MYIASIAKINSHAHRITSVEHGNVTPCLLTHSGVVSEEDCKKFYLCLFGIHKNLYLFRFDFMEKLSSVLNEINDSCYVDIMRYTSAECKITILGINVIESVRFYG